MPVVLREELRPPSYGPKYSERASRSFYAKYIEYKRQVKLANAGGAVRYQVVSMVQLVPTPLHRAFARMVYYKNTITPLHLAAAIKQYAGHAAGAEVELTEASAAVVKAVKTERKVVGVVAAVDHPATEVGSQSSTQQQQQQQQQQQGQRRQQGYGAGSGSAAGTAAPHGQCRWNQPQELLLRNGQCRWDRLIQCRARCRRQRGRRRRRR